MDKDNLAYGGASLIVKSIVNTMGLAATYALPVQGLALLYFFMRKYYGRGATVAGISRKKLEKDIIVSDTQIKKLKEERETVMKQIENLRALVEKGDKEAEASLSTAQMDLKRLDYDISDTIGRREFDKLLLVLQDHKEQLKKNGAWKDLKPPRKVVKALDKEQEKIEKSEITFSDYSDYMKDMLNSVL